MREDSFKRWLKNIKKYKTSTINTRISNCKTIEKNYGDLDKLYEKGRLNDVQKELDSGNHKIPIYGVHKTATSTYRSTLKLYLEFKDNKVLDKIKTDPDLDPDKHDGSYELVREAVESLSKMDIEELDVNDLDMLYSMAVGSWSMGIDIKREKIDNSNLPTDEKTRMKSILKEVKGKAENGKYENKERNKASIGMFGTGFHTFTKSSNNKTAKKFISLLINIKYLKDEEEILSASEKIFKEDLDGIQAGSASMMLHPLKPTVFPILTGIVRENIVVLEGEDVVLNQANKLTYYIENVRKLKSFRDEKCKFKNYRVLDLALRDVEKISNGAGPVIEEIMKMEDTSVDFSKTIDFDNLYFTNEETLRSQISIALKSGKSIILIGPPGTGKSKIASKIVESYGVDSKMVTAMSDWSSYDTIGGYKPDKDGKLYFEEGIFLSSFKTDSNQDKNQWLIIDEINRADIDKAFGPFFSALSGDDVELGLRDSQGENIKILLEENLNNEIKDYETAENEYIIPKDWRIIATMNTLDKTSLYEMSYAFMRRFAFIPVPIPKDIDGELVGRFLELWNIKHLEQEYSQIAKLWNLINKYRKIGPAIIEDIGNYIKNGGDYTSAIVIYVLPQLEGMFESDIYRFVEELKENDLIEEEDQFVESVEDFFNIKNLRQEGK